jgi:Zn finger protein HypA/HybF involved in hydrogenase expression
MILPSKCKKCDKTFDIDTSKTLCPTCRGLKEPVKIDISKFDEVCQ